MRTLSVRPLRWVAPVVGLLLSSPLAGAPPADHGPWVVRAFFGSEAAVREVASWAEHVAVPPGKGFVALEVDERGWRRLEAAGFFVEVDPVRTEAAQRSARWVRSQGAGPGIAGFPCYRTVAESRAAVEALAAAHPALVTLIDIGDSWEKTVSPAVGHDLLVLRLTNAATPGPKPPLLVTAALHARELATSELALRFAERLVTGYGHDADATWLLDHHVIHVLPQANPDGRVQSEAGVSWRKNTNDAYCTGTIERGADLNRNFDFEWGNHGGGSTDVCEETYRGAAAGSEPETQALQAYMAAIFPDQRPDDLATPAASHAVGVYADLHSFASAVLTPWGFSAPNCPGGPLPPDGPALERLARKYGFFARYETVPGSLGCVDGATKDYSYGRLGVPGYTVEMGTAFSEECSYFEEVLLPENLAALTYLAKASRAPYQLPAGPDAVAVSVPPRAIVAGTPVSVSATLDDGRYRGSEPVHTIAGGQLFVDVPPWQAGAVPLPLAAADGDFDEPVEAVTASLATGSLAVGRHTLFVRGQDAAEQWGPVTATFLEVLDPATAPQLSGVVTAVGSGTPLAATVSLAPFAEATDGAGAYALVVPPGSYTLTVESPGHEPRALPVSLAANEVRTLDLTLAPVVVRFADDAEAAEAGWTAQAPWARTTETAASGSFSWTDSPGGDYATNTDAALTSPVLDLTGLRGTVLAFAQRFELEAGFDFARVELSVDGGATWQQQIGYSGTNGPAWAPVRLALPELDGQSQARVRFRLTSDFVVGADGWHLDDIEVTAVPVGTSPLFADGFESGTLAAWAASLP